MKGPTECPAQYTKRPALTIDNPKHLEGKIKTSFINNQQK